MGSITLYELQGAEDRRFSPFCWRIRMALAHKGLIAALVPVRFTEKSKIAFSGQDKVPVLTDGERCVFDSWSIACYLEGAYPDRPSLFAGDGGMALARFVNHWTDSIVHRALSPMIVADIWSHVDAADRHYFRESREKRFGRTLEEVQADREQRLDGFRALLEPLRATLRSQPFLGGAGALYADHIVFGAFQWARCISPFRLLAADDPVHSWRERMLDLFAGLARRAQGYAC